MGKRVRTKRKADNRIRSSNDGIIYRTANDPKATLRMAPCASVAQDPPWVLKPAKNWVSGLRNADKKGINPKDALGAAKVPMHLVPPASTILQALCMDDGAIKYGPYNVRMEPIQAVGYIAAAKRHLDAYLDGQMYDPITGKPHLGYALATIGLVIDAWLGGTLIDNRPVAGIGGQLLDALAMKPGEPPRSPDELRKIFDGIVEFGKKQTEERLNANSRT